jgi:hypothetical protein
MALVAIITGYNIWPLFPSGHYLNDADGMGTALCLVLIGYHAFLLKKSFIKLVFVSLAVGNAADEFVGNPFNFVSVEYWAAALTFVLCIIEWKRERGYGR